MAFQRELNRLAFGLLIGFGLVALAAAYWSVVGPDSILQRPDNPRRVEVEQRIQRGQIYDRQGNLLATSSIDTTGRVTRRYQYDEMASALGYASLRYGVSGAEAAFNPILRGEDIPSDLSQTLMNDWLHRAQIGSDIRLTFDLTIQQAVLDLMAGRRGAAVMLSVPDGAVLSLVSLPSYAPNTLDENWDLLVQDAGKPFFNRVLQGVYQPGAILQTPLLATALLVNYSLDDVTENADQPVKVGDVEFNCLMASSSSTFSLNDAYRFGCPYPFKRLIENLGLDVIQSGFDSLGLNTPATLTGYVDTAVAIITATPSRSSLNRNNYVEGAMGQGGITITPLEMAVLTAAITNAGNAPTPFTLLQIRRPGSDTWLDAPPTMTATPLMTADVARQLQTLMTQAVVEGAAQDALQDELAIGGQAALAYSGSEALTWFIGFVQLDGQRNVVIALVLEDTADTALASQIGGAALAAAYEHLQAISPLPTAGA